jgi:hypothetical protein
MLATLKISKAFQRTSPSEFPSEATFLVSAAAWQEGQESPQFAGSLLGKGKKSRARTCGEIDNLLRKDFDHGPAQISALRDGGRDRGWGHPGRLGGFGRDA